MLGDGSLVQLAQIVVVGMISIGCVRYTVNHAKARVELGKKRVELLRDRRNDFSKIARTKAKESLGIRRQAIYDIQALDGIEREIRRIHDKLSDRVVKDDRVIVVDERKREKDRAWHVVMKREGVVPENEPTNVTAAWQQGRIFMAWGADEDSARTKVVQKFPAHQGYECVAVRPGTIF